MEICYTKMQVDIFYHAPSEHLNRSHNFKTVVFVTSSLSEYYNFRKGNRYSYEEYQGTPLLRFRKLKRLVTLASSIVNKDGRDGKDASPKIQENQLLFYNGSVCV